MITPKILIIGLTGAGATGLSAEIQTRIITADLLLGGHRHLRYFPHFTGETLPITANIEAVVQRLQQAVEQGQQAVVLASGDPLCFGIGSTLRRYLPATTLEIIPAPSAFQLAFAALGEPWHDAIWLSAHARPLDEVVARVLVALKAAILTDNDHTPTVIAQALLGTDLSPDSPVAICENLGGAEQRVVRTTLGQVTEQTYAPLNVFIIWPESGRRQPTVQRPFPPGLADEALSTSAGQITKREVRLLSLAELAFKAGEVMWDIGAGSGAVGLEAARAQPTARVYAIEKRAKMWTHLQENLTRFPAENFHGTQGVAPLDIKQWPRPHAVFIGGSGGHLSDIIEVVQQRLHPGGRLVINLATLENLQQVRGLLPAAQIKQIQISRGVPIMDMLRFEALNPIFIVTWQKEND